VSIYNPLLKFIKEGRIAVKESDTLKAFAKPVAIGAGAGVGGYAALRGIGEGIESMGASTAKEGKEKLTGLLMFVAVVLVVIYAIQKLTRFRR
jgi:hypothetical protein